MAPVPTRWSVIAHHPEATGIRMVRFPHRPPWAHGVGETPGAPVSGAPLDLRAGVTHQWGAHGVEGPAEGPVGPQRDPRPQAQGSGLEPPHPPCGPLSSGSKNRPNPTPFGVEFFRILAPCGAKSRGGGGAPPTTLILLRNQRPARALNAVPSTS